MTPRFLLVSIIATASLLGGATARSEAPGVTRTEIKLGQTMPYSGPASAFSTIGMIELAYFNMINSKGGVNGRKINMISLDDAYSPPKTVEQVRKLVEQEEVFAVIGSLGTPTNAAVQRFLNNKKVPHIFVQASAPRFADPQTYPYTTSLYPPSELEGQIFAKYLLRNKPDAKLGVLSSNDDAGKDYVKGLKDGLGDKAGKIIVKEVTYESTEPTIDSRIVTLKASGADTMFTMATAKFAAQAIRKMAELQWRPLNFLVSVSSSVGGVLEPAGLDASKGLLTALVYKTATDPRWQDDKDVQEFHEFMKQWFPRGNASDQYNTIGYISAFLTVKLLEMCGEDLTRENLIKQATNLDRVHAPLLLPGITITTTPQRYLAYSKMQLARFDGTSWVPEGPLLSSEDIDQ